MKVKPSWIQFELLPRPKIKTKVWEVVTIDGKTSLGEIKWFGRWRTYAFFPVAKTVYEPHCLYRIIDFINLRMNDYREERKKTKQKLIVDKHEGER